MFRNYFKTAWRNIIRSKGYSALNVFGLATGMAVALLIGLWVYNEYSYDRFLPGYRQAYQVRRNFNSNGDTLNFPTTSLKLADILRRDIPEIGYVAEADWSSSHGLMVAGKKFYMAGTQVGGDFLKIFPYPLLKGKTGSVMSDPFSIVLTESTARTLFGKEDPMGKKVRLDNRNDLKVTGILKDLPANSTFQFRYLIPFAFFEQTNADVRSDRTGGFGNNNYQLFVGLKPGIPYAQVAPKIRDIERTEKDNVNAMNSMVVMQPLADWRLYSEYTNGKALGGFIDYVRMFSIIGGLVLLIACINFINLTTARSEKRAREVGVRKAIGSQRSDLILQFLLESILLSFIAFLFSLLIASLALPAFNALTGGSLSIPFASGIFWSVMLGCVLITALVAGSRPAFYLSAFNPVEVLKGSMHLGKAKALPRKILVVIQFSCSVALIISTIIVYQQIQYARERPSGFDANRLMMTDMNYSTLNHNYTALKNEMLQKGLVASVTRASSPATDIGWHSNIDNWPGKQAGETIEMGTIVVAEDYFKTLGIGMREGRDFSGRADTTCVIFNEMAIQRMRIKDPLNKTIGWQGQHLRIIGVAKDALMVSPFAPADPTMFLCLPDGYSSLIYRLAPHIKTQDAIAQLTVLFDKYNPVFPYAYQFVDQSYAAKFSLELFIGKLAGIFATLAVFISCLGLFGLAAYVAEQRTKEIGIRKVLGASIPGIWLLLSKDFMLLVLISCGIASPLALYFLQNWLGKYSYRISIGPWVFVWAAMAAVIITLVTISFQAIRAALANPVRSLRSE
ncbi:MAG TPA: ABC transporter permease [Puia sp.]|nr:ABC transporter permease [Puia sp.]